MTTILRLPHFLPAMISRAAAAASSDQEQRIDRRRQSPADPGRNADRNRPATQTENSNTSGPPCSGSRPVQFGTAVSRKPATTAAIYPNSISWTCQSRGANAVAVAASRRRPAATPGWRAPA